MRCRPSSPQTDLPISFRFRQRVNRRGELGMGSLGECNPKPYTRKRRVEVSISKMKSGKRRPCCFNLAACTTGTCQRTAGLLSQPDLSSFVGALIQQDPLPERTEAVEAPRNRPRP